MKVLKKHSVSVWSWVSSIFYDPNVCFAEEEEDSDEDSDSDDDWDDDDDDDYDSETEEGGVPLDDSVCPVGQYFDGWSTLILYLSEMPF